MYKVVILGCENSHANIFLNEFTKKQDYKDVEIVGVYSEEQAAAEKIHEEYGIYVAEQYDEFAGKIDGLIITARHGDNHYKYARPYLESKIPMFIDKPITVSQKDASEFRHELKTRNIPICGGSMCKYDAYVQKLKNMVREKAYGKLYGGYLRSPFSLDNIYGGFYFYSQHLVQVLCEIFGYYPKAVSTFKNGTIYTCVFRYEEFDVTGVFVDGNYSYYASISCEKGLEGSMYELEDCGEKEVRAFYDILIGKTQEQSYEDFFAPVFILNAIERSAKSGKEETIEWS